RRWCRKSLQRSEDVAPASVGCNSCLATASATRSAQPLLEVSPLLPCRGLTAGWLDSAKVVQSGRNFDRLGRDGAVAHPGTARRKRSEGWCRWLRGQDLNL